MLSKWCSALALKAAPAVAGTPCPQKHGPRAGPRAAPAGNGG